MAQKKEANADEINEEVDVSNNADKSSAIEVASSLPSSDIAEVSLVSELPSAPPENDEPRLSLKVFLKVSGKRSDQTAGFRRWASSRNVGEQTVTQWKNLFDEFSRRLVK